MRRAALLLAALLPAPLLGGCEHSQTAAQVTGLAAGGIAGGASANPAVGYAVGIATAVAADEFLKWAGRVRAHGEQEAIAAAAAGLPEGQAGPWRIAHTIPVGDEDGEVRVVRALSTPLAECREIVFSVADPPRAPRWFATTICRATDGAWHWALAEPAVPRWGYLQGALP
jgi:hypothetical protein